MHDLNIAYNTQLDNIAIKEYGRNVQRMVDYALQIEDREERTAAAYQIVKIMEQLNPDYNKSNDYDHKLWDHLFIMSGFQLDVDAPYEMPKPEMLQKRPELPAYNTGRVEFRHYGNLVEQMIYEACREDDDDKRKTMANYIAAYMKWAYMNWNEEKVADDVIIKNLSDMSGGALKVQSITEIADSASIKAPGNKNAGHRKKKKSNNNKRHKRRHKR